MGDTSNPLKGADIRDGEGVDDEKNKRRGKRRQKSVIVQAQKSLSAHLHEMIKLAQKHDALVQLTVLPEAALASVWPREPNLVKKMVEVIGSSSSRIATGILRSDKTGHLYNSVLFFDRGGQMQQMYDKHKDEDDFLYMTYSSENTFGR